MSDESIIRTATFNPRVRHYWLLSGTVILIASVFGIALLPFWLIGGLFVTGRYLRRLSCVLTERALHFRKGLLIRVEKSVPLDKITDVGTVQGPIMRLLDLEALSVETAGQSSPGALIKLVGVRDNREFRDAILRQRDQHVAELKGERTAGVVAGAQPAGPDAADGRVLTEIRDALLRIEEVLRSQGGRGR